jgi:arsenate reductase
MQTTIWHNPRCSKSRATLQLLEDNGVTPSVVLYLTNPPSAHDITATLRLLNMGVRGIIRKGEAAFSQNNLGNQDLNNEQIIDILVKNPILIERPIVIKGDKAIIGRPPENVLNLL